MKKSLRSIVAIIAVACAALVGCAKKADAPAAQAQTDKSMITITNNTGAELNELVISAASNENDWEETNHLDGKTVKDGESFQIARSIFTAAESYDLAFSSTDDKSYFKLGVDVKTVDALSVTKDDELNLTDTTSD